MARRIVCDNFPVLAGNDPGYLAATFTPPASISGQVRPGFDLDAHSRHLPAPDDQAPTERHSTPDGSTEVLTWGLKPAFLDPSDSSVTYKLVQGARLGNHALDGEALHSHLGERPPAALGKTLAPFAALTVRGSSATVVTDVLGARHLYRTSGPGWEATSTSPHLLARMSGASLDREALAVQSFMGFSLGLRSLYTGVSKLDGATGVTLISGVASEFSYSPTYGGLDLSPTQAVAEAAAFLREYMSAYVDENPGAILQLTGGQDSRLILSGVPRSRRHQLTAMTLMTPDGGDVRVASDLAQRFGMRHQVVTLDGLDTMAAAEAYERSMAASLQLGCMADPLEHAALLWAEEKMEQGPRLAGVGGEVGRGYYYPGPPVVGPVIRPLSRTLARWRMFSNLAVDRSALAPEFADWAEEFALEDVHQRLVRTGLGWMQATDHFFLHEKMHRWAGITETGVCFDREVTNPLLDRRWLDIVCSLSPMLKRNGRFFNQVQMALDPELSRIPLEGRPTPEVYASASVSHSATLASMFGRRVVRKARQRLARETRPPYGGGLLAGKVLDHCRTHPEVLEPVRTSGVFGTEWLDRVIAGELDPDPATLALMINVAAASQSLAAGSGGSALQAH